MQENVLDIRRDSVNLDTIAADGCETRRKHGLVASRYVQCTTERNHLFDARPALEPVVQPDEIAPDTDQVWSACLRTRSPASPCASSVPYEM